MYDTCWSSHYCDSSVTVQELVLLTVTTITRLHPEKERQAQVPQDEHEENKRVK